ncbi:MAG: hypothetical protein U0X75_26810 [Acidobacteriota bacterium]
MLALVSRGNAIDAPAHVIQQPCRNLFSNLLPLLIVATGQTIVLIAGGIDLSVTSVMALGSVTGALVMSGDQGLLSGSAWLCQRA